ncbi:hypothetical protein [Indioceanicola profundi]|uniref:hypothetical protein n=1 Tax=Indioceanicola profundi TaxID=2220096 RepID=UPI0013C4BC85|nr:hypothetical protein [Indioceanicola profundi]
MSEHIREPKLHELLDDPLVRLVMARDGLSPDEVRRVVEATSDRLSRRRREEMRTAA